MMGRPKKNSPKAYGQPKGLSKVFTAAVYKAFLFSCSPNRRVDHWCSFHHICIPYLFWCLDLFSSLGGYLMFFLWFRVVEKKSKNCPDLGF
jgi:hypothetical protein